MMALQAQLREEVVHEGQADGGCGRCDIRIASLAKTVRLLVDEKAEGKCSSLRDAIYQLRKRGLDGAHVKLLNQLNAADSLLRHYDHSWEDRVMTAVSNVLGSVASHEDATSPAGSSQNSSDEGAELSTGSHEVQDQAARCEYFDLFVNEIKDAEVQVDIPVQAQPDNKDGMDHFLTPCFVAQLTQRDAGCYDKVEQKVELERKAMEHEDFRAHAGREFDDIQNLIRHFVDGQKELQAELHDVREKSAALPALEARVDLLLGKDAVDDGGVRSSKKKKGKSKNT
eukprot:TRINITY_DN8495_c0_g1_i1.p1 TRINITY_DN8495_c0_g1~~TRINITY_DN8495_c0_g1_i1.p1  ORF type:complete len:284 (-),score=84.31 TRINITY_DN8495_c0_g1_i1:263-1114(-)